MGTCGAAAPASLGGLKGAGLEGCIGGGVMVGFEGAFKDEGLHVTKVGPGTGEVMRFKGGGPGRKAAGALEPSCCGFDRASKVGLPEPRDSSMPF